MGYETKLIIGKASALVRDEWARSPTPYSDGSGFEPQRDPKTGQPLLTGRKEHWFHEMVTIDMCKLGYDGELSDLGSRSHALAKANLAKDFHFFYADDGNTQITEDRYGDPMWPMPIAEVLAAAKAHPDAKTYRRLRWAIALLESMAEDGEGLSILFYGY
jgi:hypothetical protein